MSRAIASGSAGTRGHLPRAALLAAGVVAYQFLVQFSLASPQGTPFAGLLAALPVFLLAVWLLRRTTILSRFAGAASAVAVPMVASSHGMTPALTCFVVQIAVYATMFGLFARTLRAGRRPLITCMARSVHGVLPEQIERYTRRVTWYWSGVLALMAAISVALFLLAPLSAWSLFANVLNAPLLACAFVAEYIWRVVRYPHFSHASMLASLDAFRRVAGRGGTLLHD